MSLTPFDQIPGCSTQRSPGRKQIFRRDRKNYSFYSIIVNASKCIYHRLSIFLTTDPNKGYLFGYFAIVQWDSKE